LVKWHDAERGPVRAVGTDPRTGKKKAVEKLYDGVIAQEAARNRAALIAEIEAATRVATKQRVSDFARSWIASKAVSVDATTASTYADALEQHVLPVLGDSTIGTTRWHRRRSGPEPGCGGERIRGSQLTAAW
jgi:hypothetical protein